MTYLHYSVTLGRTYSPGQLQCISEVRSSNALCKISKCCTYSIFLAMSLNICHKWMGSCLNVTVYISNLQVDSLWQSTFPTHKSGSRSSFFPQIYISQNKNEEVAVFHCHFRFRTYASGKSSLRELFNSRHYNPGADLYVCSQHPCSAKLISLAMWASRYSNDNSNLVWHFFIASR